MQNEENSAELPAGRRPLKLVLGFLSGLVPGISIVLILNLLNRNGRFALLSGVFGLLLYDVLVSVKWMFDLRLDRRTARERQGLVGEEARRAFIAMVWPWLLLYCALGIGAVVGLLWLPGQQSLLFALISGALGLLFCISAFRLMFAAGIMVLIFFGLPRWEKALNPPTGEGDRAADEHAG